MSYSVVEYYGKQISRCGYCKQDDSSHSHGMHAYLMLCKDYQDLIDRGWRRSGSYCYKPDMRNTCCPCYTIRCDTQNFQLTKSHKKVLKRMNKFLRDGVMGKASAEDGEPSEEGGEHRMQADVPASGTKNINVDEIESAGDHIGSSSGPTTSSAAEAHIRETEESKVPRKKAKQMRIERKQAKLAEKGVADEVLKKKSNTPKTLRDYIEDVSENDRHKLKVVLVPASKAVTSESFEIYKKYQTTIHKDQPSRLTTKQFERFLVKSPLKLKLVDVKSSEFKKSLNESFGLYLKYQTVVHKAPPENSQEYLEFLQTSPLKRDKSAADLPSGFGSFHQQYWLDDKLIAVGVIDILPSCISSVYLFYDPDYSFLSLGTYGSLREIDFTQQLHERVPDLKYYYMGFYIHSCPKMRYKGKLSPSFLTCPETYLWYELNDEIRAKLDASKYTRFTNDTSKSDIQEFLEPDLDNVLVLLEGRTMGKYRQYIQSVYIPSIDNMLDTIRSRIYAEITGENDVRDSVLEYGKLVGKQCAHRMLFVIS